MGQNPNKVLYRSLIIAHLNREEFARLDLKTDQNVYLEPRQIRSFESDKQDLAKHNNYQLAR